MSGTEAEVRTILITGFTGTGKSTLARHLRLAGHDALSTDDDPLLAQWVDQRTGLAVERPDEPDRVWLASHHWIWQPQRLDDVIIQHRSAGVARLWLCGNADNAEQLRDRFHVVILLVTDIGTVLARVDQESRGNDWGRVGDSRVELIANHERWNRDQSTWADHIIDATWPVDEVVAAVLRLSG